MEKLRVSGVGEELKDQKLPETLLTEKGLVGALHHLPLKSWCYSQVRLDSFRCKVHSA